MRRASTSAYFARNKSTGTRMLCRTCRDALPRNKIGEKTMTVRAHGHQVAALFLNPFGDLFARFAVSQFSLGGNAGGLKFSADFLQIGRVLGDFPD